MTWHFVLPDYLPPRLNELLRGHWSRRHRALGEATAMVSIYGRHVPRALGRRKVSLTFVCPGTLRDGDASDKLILDALVKCNLLVDDSPKWLERAPTVVVGGGRRVEVTLEDLP